MQETSPGLGSWFLRPLATRKFPSTHTVLLELQEAWRPPRNCSLSWSLAEIPEMSQDHGWAWGWGLDGKQDEVQVSGCRESPREPGDLHLSKGSPDSEAGVRWGVRGVDMRPAF